MPLITIQAHGQEARITGQVVRKHATDNGTGDQVVRTPRGQRCLGNLKIMAFQAVSLMWQNVRCEAHDGAGASET